MNNLSPEINALLHLTSDLYNKPLTKLPSFSEINIPKLHRLSIENKLGFYASKALITQFSGQIDPKDEKVLKSFVFSCETKIEKLSEATRVLKESLRNFIVVKTFRGYDVIPNDIDVLVPNIKESVQDLKAHAKVQLLDAEPNQLMVLIGGQKVHLHEKISWANSEFLDSQLIATNLRTVQLWRIDVNIPNVNADFLTYLAHMNFEPLHFTLSDLIYLCKIAPTLKWAVTFNQAKKYHWIRALTQSLTLLDSFHHTLYSEPCPFEELNLHHSPTEAHKIEFPKSIPRWQIINAFLEKRAFGYLTQKLSKSVQVLITGDTYNNFYVPPEQTVTKSTGVV